MVLAITLDYEDDASNPVATETAVNVVVTDNDTVTRGYLAASLAGQETAKSPVFAGDYTWLGWIAPAAGTWAFKLLKEEDDSELATLSKAFDAAS